MNNIIETIRAEIERRKGYISVTHFAEELLAKLSDLEKEEKPSEGLEEEIYSFWDYFYGKDRRVTRATNIYDFGNIARHFAQWQKEQMMKEAVEVDTRFAIRNSEGFKCALWDVLTSYGVIDGGKFKMIIIKEE